MVVAVQLSGAGTARPERRRHVGLRIGALAVVVGLEPHVQPDEARARALLDGAAGPHVAVLDDRARQGALRPERISVAHLRVVEPSVNAPVAVNLDVPRERLDVEEAARRVAGEAVAAARRRDDAVVAGKCGRTREERRDRHDRPENQHLHLSTSSSFRWTLRGLRAAVLNVAGVWNRSDIARAAPAKENSGLE